MSLEVLTDQDGTRAREPKVVGRTAAAAIAFYDNRTIENGVAVFTESAIQESLSRRRKLFLSIRAVLEQFR